MTESGLASPWWSDNTHTRAPRRAAPGASQSPANLTYQPGSLELLPRVPGKAPCGLGYTHGGRASPTPNTHSLDTWVVAPRLRAVPEGGGLVGDDHRLWVFLRMLIHGKDPAFSLRPRVCGVASAPCVFTSEV